MTTIVFTPSQPMTIYLNSSPPSGGILLNGTSPTRNSPRSYRSQDNDEYGTSKSLPPSAKIRFAPLPDPRKASSDDDKSPSASPILLSSKSEPQQLPGSYSDSRQSDETDRDDASSPQRNKAKKTFLKAFLNVSTTPDATNNLGLGLFRSSSRDSASSSDDADGSSADVSSVAGSNRKRSRASSKESASRLSFTGKSGRSVSPFRRSSPVSASATCSQSLPVPSPKSKSQPLRPTISAPSVVESATKKKLLNGHVYGARGNQGKQAAWAEPEFVEWGYGGMGSVRSGEAFYGGVQAGTSAVIGVDDDYEASGMAWVRRRRAEKERKEKEEREKMEREAETGSEASGSPITPKIVVSDEHDCRTVNIPHHHHHHHSRQFSRGGSAAATPHASTVFSGNTSNGTRKTTSPLALSNRQSYEDVSSVNSSDDGSSPRGEDDDEEEDIRDERRATSIGAGKEKFSRHHRE